MSEGPKRRKMREQSKNSLRAVARQMGISAMYLCDLERGHRKWSEELMTSHTGALESLAKKNPTLAKG